ncbi:hypothetical protein JB92DRAFT_439283 [Gautieria morchelliformis]|nr:hypothetical protein JB92DRAFT_439283 [Gautieria morchelliformis]
MDNEAAVLIPAPIRGVKIYLKCNQHPSIRIFGKRPGKYYVKLFVDEDVKTAVAARGNAASWDESFYFNDLHGSSVLGIKVYRHHTIGNDEYIGGAKERIELLLAEGASGGQ